MTADAVAWVDPGSPFGPRHFGRHVGQLDAPGVERVLGGGASRAMETVAEQPLKFNDPDTFRRNRHHHARQTRLRLAQLERVHRLPAGAQLRRERFEAEASTRPRWIPPKLRAKRRVDEQPLDQLARAFELVLSERHG
jgi:hypothetical protein